MNDTENLSEEHLPSLIDFDTVYYYSFDNEKDDTLCLGSVKTVDIFTDQLQIKTVNSNEHEFVLDVGKKKYEFIAPTKFMAQQWVEAIECSHRTSSENRQSITGQIKNISKIVTLYELDRDALKDDILEGVKEKLQTMDIDSKYIEFEEIHLLLELCTQISDEMVTIFDACLAQPKARKDIIEMFMGTTHIELIKRLTHEWEKRAMEMEAIEIF